MRTRSRTKAGQYAALLAYVVFLGFPLLWLFSTAFKSPAELTKLTPTVFPTDWTLGNFDVAFKQTQLWSALRNSLVVAVATAVVTTVIACRRPTRSPASRAGCATSPSAGSSSARSSRSSSSSSRSSSCCATSG